MTDALIVLLRSTLVLAVALGIGVALRRFPSARLAVYRWSLLAVLLIASCPSPLRERENPVVPVSWSVPYTAVKVTAPAASHHERADLSKSSAVVAGAPAAETAISRVDLVRVALAIYGTVAGLLLLYLVAGLLKILAIRRRCRAITDERCLAVLRACTREIGVGKVRLAEGEVIASPFVAGLLRPTIFLPAFWKDDASEETLKAVFVHEVAHLASGDLRWNSLHRAVCALLWPQPLLWLLRRPMLAASEELCDQRVLATGIPKARYAQCLLDLKSGRSPSLAVGAVSSRSSLGRRVEAILDARRPMSRRLGKWMANVMRVSICLIASVVFWAVAKPSGPATQLTTAGMAGVASPYQGRIRVIGFDGKPVQNARAWIVYMGQISNPPAEEMRVEGSEVVVDPKRAPGRTVAALTVYAPGIGLEFWPLWPATKKLDEVHMPKPTSIHGRLKLPSGAPAAGIRVTPYLLNHRTHSDPAGPSYLTCDTIPNIPVSAVTGSDGSFTLVGLPPDTTVGYETNDPAFARLRMADRVDTPASGAVEANVVLLTPSAHLRGRVTRDGKPVPGVRIDAQGNHLKDMDGADLWGSAVSDDRGTFDIGRLYPGAYNVAADLQGGLDREVTAVAHEGVQVGRGASISGLDFQLVPGVVISGRVADAEGRALAEVPVGVYGPAHPSSSAWVQVALTDREGRYTLHVPAGKQYVYLASDRYTAKPFTGEVRVGATMRLDFRAEAKTQDPESGIAPAREESGTSDERPSADQRQVGPVASFGPGETFYGPATLTNGVTVRLKFLQEDTKQPHHLWRPDGSVPDPADVATSLNMRNFTPSAPARRLFAGIDIKGAGTDYSCVVQVPHPSDWTVWQAYGDEGHRSMSMATFKAPLGLEVTDLRFGVAAGPWRTLASGVPGQAPLFTTVGLPGRYTNWSLPEAAVCVSVRLPEEAKNRDIRLEAFDTNGKRMRLLAWESDAFPMRVFAFAGNSVREVARAELRVRDFSWTTFKGIRLRPRF